MSLGKFQQGDSVPVKLLCRDGSGTPAVPAHPPRLAVWNDAGTKVLSAPMPILERYVTAGLFYYPLYLGASFPAGRYRVAFSWKVGSFAGCLADDFSVGPLGNKDGAVVSMFFFPRPNAGFVLQGLESGKIVQGRNPTV